MTKDNSELKNLQNSRAQSEQETIRGLREDLDKIKRELEGRESELQREIRSKNEALNRK